jgi:hypothetical protein
MPREVRKQLIGPKMVQLIGVKMGNLLGSKWAIDWAQNGAADWAQNGAVCQLCKRGAFGVRAICYPEFHKLFTMGYLSKLGS